jgi:hypothetical protein
MKKRVIITTVVSFVLLVAVVLAGLNAIFTVTSVRAQFHAYSAEGDREARELQEKLDAFIDSSIVFLELDEVKARVDEYPCFRLESVKKHFPDKLELRITERKEAFAYSADDGTFEILDEQGGYLYRKDANVNRMGGENILLNGFEFSVESGEVQGEYFTELVGVFESLRSVLAEVRTNVLSIALVHGGNAAQNDYIRIFMREGVVIQINNPQERAQEKAMKAISRYAGKGEYEGKGLTDKQLVTGVLTVVDALDELILDYHVN